MVRAEIAVTPATASAGPTMNDSSTDIESSAYAGRRRSGGTSAAMDCREGDIACDEILFERLRALRKKLADERRVPAYIVFGDTTLRAMARHYPDNVGQMEGIPGMGEKKRAEFGEAFANEIAEYLKTNSRVAFE